MYKDLKGKVAVVTGAGRGIGRVTAQALDEEGCYLVLNDINEDDLQATRELLSQPDKTVLVSGDIAQPATAVALVSQAKTRFGNLDIWINNAAHSLFGLLAECSDDQWDAVMDVTLRGAFLGLRSALNAMLAQEPSGGVIINISSGAALGGEQGLGAYAAAKAALANLTQTTAVENARSGIRCNAVLPGPIATPPMLAAAAQAPGGVAQWASQTVPGRLGEPGEIANAILFLASEQASYINGVLLSVDGGISARTGTPQF